MTCPLSGHPYVCKSSARKINGPFGQRQDIQEGGPEQTSPPPARFLLQCGQEKAQARSMMVFELGQVMLTVVRTHCVRRPAVSSLLWSSDRSKPCLSPSAVNSRLSRFASLAFMASAYAECVARGGEEQRAE